MAFDKENLVGKKLYVGNLTYSVTSSDLQEWFTPFGTVQSAQVISDRDTGRSKGFGFVEMDTDAQAQAAIQGLHDHEHDGRRLTVNEAKPRVARTAASLVVALTAVVALAVVMVMEVMVVSIDRPPSRWVSRGSLVRSLDPSGAADESGLPVGSTAFVAVRLPTMRIGGL